MKTSLLVSLAVILAVFVLPVVLAVDVATIDLVEVDGMDTASGSVAIEAGQTVPVRVEFTSNMNASEVEVTAWIVGERSDAASKALPDLIIGREYNAKLSLQIPSKLDETEEELTLVVEIETDEGSVREERALQIQREPYNANVLFVEIDSMVEAGTNVPVDVVVKNLGRHELDDLVVKATVEQLGISKRAYFGDLTPLDNWEDDEDAEDSAQGRLYLKIPVNAQAGTYELVVEAYNEDTMATVRKSVTVVGAEKASEVLVPVSSRELATGEEKTYSLIIVNSGDNIGVYEVVPETAEGVIVSVENPIVTVPAGSSQLVELQVKAGSREGTYSFAVDVSSEGQLIETAVMNANVVKGGVATGSNLTVLTVILAIVFVVLLIVLIVLLTKKPSKAEEFEESYY